MALITGTPLGNVDSSEELYLEGAPYIYYQDASATPFHNPDSDGFYWGLSGTTTYPAYELGCPVGVSLTENLTINDILCDNIGVKSTIQQRNYLEFTFTLQQFFPLANLAGPMKGSAVVVNSGEGTEKMGLGTINQNKFYMLYCPKVYDTDTGDWVLFHMHRAQFVDAWTLNTPLGNTWQLTGVKLRAYADTTKAETQKFGVFIRVDPSVI
jgi:hypothetical protein